MHYSLHARLKASFSTELFSIFIARCADSHRLDVPSLQSTSTMWVQMHTTPHNTDAGVYGGRAFSATV